MYNVGTIFDCSPMVIVVLKSTYNGFKEEGEYEVNITNKESGFTFDTNLSERNLQDWIDRGRVIERLPIQPPKILVGFKFK